MAPKARYLILKRSDCEFNFREKGISSGENLESIAQDVVEHRESMEVEELDEQEAADAESDLNNEVILSMPFTLIKPFKPETSVEGTTQEIGDGKKVATGIVDVLADGIQGGGRKVKVAVIDTGINANHAAFPEDEIMMEFRDFTKTVSGEPAKPVDEDGHGTHCAGTIFGRDVDGVRIGVATGVKHALIARVFGSGKHSGSTEALRNALLWAIANGANVISLSLGIDYYLAIEQLQKKGFDKEVAVSMAMKGYRDNLRLFDGIAQVNQFSNNSLIFAATGNESKRNVDPMHVIFANLPAVAENVIPIGSVRRTTSQAKPFEVSDFSNIGPQFCAPGEGVLSATHDDNNGLVGMRGTSMATPHAAGVACLHGDLVPERDSWAKAILDRMIESARRIPGRRRDLGHGLVQAPV